MLILLVGPHNSRNTFITTQLIHVCHLFASRRRSWLIWNTLILQCFSSKPVVNNRMIQWVDKHVHLPKRNLSLSSRPYEPQIHSHDLHTVNTECKPSHLPATTLPINSSCELIGRVTASPVALLLLPVTHTPFQWKTWYHLLANCNDLQTKLYSGHSIMFNISTKSALQSI